MNLILGYLFSGDSLPQSSVFPPLLTSAQQIRCHTWWNSNASSFLLTLVFDEVAQSSLLFAPLPHNTSWLISSLTSRWPQDSISSFPVSVLSIFSVLSVILVSLKMQLHNAHPPLCACACSASHFPSVRTWLLLPAAKEPVERPKEVFLFAVFHCCIHQYDLKHNESFFRSLASCSFFVLLFILFRWNYFPFSLVIYPVLSSRQSCHLVPFHCLWWPELCSRHCHSDYWPSPLAVGLLKKGARGFCSWCTFASA